jgi:hypothetical protein
MLPVHFALVILEMRSHNTISPGWPQAWIFSISASQIARITGMSRIYLYLTLIQTVSPRHSFGEPILGKDMFITSIQVLLDLGLHHIFWCNSWFSEAARASYIKPGTSLIPEICTPVAHTCNPSYSGGRDQEDHGSKPVQANSPGNPTSKEPII